MKRDGRIRPIRQTTTLPIIIKMLKAIAFPVAICLLFACSTDKPDIEIEKAVRAYYSAPRALTSAEIAADTVARQMANAASAVNAAAIAMNVRVQNLKDNTNKSVPVSSKPIPGPDRTPYPPYKVLGVSIERRTDLLYVVRADVEPPSGETKTEMKFCRQYTDQQKPYWKVEDYS